MEDIALWIAAISSGSLLIIKGLQIIARLTKTTKDDEILAKVRDLLESAGAKEPK